jgi:hypothetical protein
MANFSDPFTGTSTTYFTAGNPWTVTKGDWHLVSDTAEQQSTPTGDTHDDDIIVYNTSCTAVEQYFRYKIVNVPGTDYQYWGAMFRWPNITDTYYLLQWARYEDDWEWTWRDTNGVGEARLATLPATAATRMAAGDTVGITLSGVGTAAVIRVWKNPTNISPVNATNWDAASDPPDGTLTWGLNVSPTPSSSLAVNTGYKLGFQIFNNQSTKLQIDNFYGGDIGSSAPTGTPVLSVR